MSEQIRTVVEVIEPAKKDGEEARHFRAVHVPRNRTAADTVANKKYEGPVIALHLDGELVWVPTKEAALRRAAGCGSEKFLEELEACNDLPAASDYQRAIDADQAPSTGEGPPPAPPTPAEDAEDAEDDAASSGIESEEGRDVS